MQPDAVQKDAPEGACRSIGVVPTPEACHASPENSSQAELISDDPRCPAARQPDPDAKPTWARWARMDKYRRILNDWRIAGHDAAFKLWHWYDNSKDRNGRVTGFRCQAWYIARKHKWKLATVYAANRLLAACGYLDYDKGQGSQPTCKPLAGISELPEGEIQKELPFLVPARAECAPAGINDPAKCAPTGTPCMPNGKAKCAPAGTPYTKCELNVIGKCDEPPRQLWQIQKELSGMRALWDRMQASPKTEEWKDRCAKAKQLIRRLEDEMIGYSRAQGNAPKTQPIASQQEERPASPVPPDPPGPKPGDPGYEEYKRSLFG